LYRLNVIELELLPLHQRPDDILPLAEYFLSAKFLDDSAERALLNYAWPGNVRELQNTISRAELLGAEQTLSADDLNLPEITGMHISSVETLDEGQLRAALKRANGVIAKAARELGLSRQALYRRMDKFGIERNADS